MPIIRTENIIDFTSCKVQEKMEIVFELLEKQKKLAAFTSESLNLTPSVNSYLQFVIAICNATFSAIIFHSFENKTYTFEELLSFYSKKLDEYIIENVETDFLVLDF